MISPLTRFFLSIFCCDNDWCKKCYGWQSDYIVNFKPTLNIQTLLVLELSYFCQDIFSWLNNLISFSEGCFVIKQGAFKGLGSVAYKLANFYLTGTIGFEGQQHLRRMQIFMRSDKFQAYFKIAIEPSTDNRQAFVFVSSFIIGKNIGLISFKLM